MQDFSPVDGFMDVKEGVDEMIKYLANEPSVGLFFVQQHAHTSMPYLLGVKDKIMEEMHEVTLHTEDIEDSIQVLNSMSECGLPIAIDMIQDINRSLRIMSTSQPKKGLIQNPMSGFHTDRSSSNLSADFNYNARSIHEDGKSRQSYISTFFNSAKQKVAGVKWAQANKGSSESIRCEPHASHKTTFSATELDIPPNLINADAELPLSSHSVNDNNLEEPVPNIRNSQDDIPSMFEPFDKFSSDQEAKLEKWLREA